MAWGAAYQYRHPSESPLTSATASRGQNRLASRADDQIQEVSSRPGPRWRLVETGVAWQASIAGYGELALKGGVGSSWTHERFLLSVTTADLPHRRPRDTRTLAREVDQVLLCC